VKYRLWCKVDPVAVGEGQAFDALALVDDPVDALSILNDPSIVLVADARVQARDTLIGDAYIVARQAANGDQRLVQPALTDYPAVEFDEDTRLFERSLLLLWLRHLWLPTRLAPVAATTTGARTPAGIATGAPPGVGCLQS